MSKRLLAVLGLVATLGLGTPAMMADHGDKDKHQHGNKHDDQDDDHAWERRDGYEYRVYGVLAAPCPRGNGGGIRRSLRVCVKQDSGEGQQYDQRALDKC